MLVATVSGNLGRDAELKTLNSGDSVLEFSIASSKKVKGEDQTIWVRASLFGKRGASLAQYLTKGTKVVCSGELNVREYRKQDGGHGVSVDLRVSELDLMGGGQKPASKSNDAPGAAAADDGCPF